MTHRAGLFVCHVVKRGVEQKEAYGVNIGYKKTRQRGFLEQVPRLLNLGFLIHNVFACYRIKFLNFHFFRHVTFILGRGLEVSGTFGGNEADFFTSSFLSHALLLTPFRHVHEFLAEPHQYLFYQ